MIKLYNFDELKPEEILNRDIRAEKNVEDVVDGIIADVRARGDEALKDYALKFDGAVIGNLQVTQEEIDDSVKYLVAKNSLSNSCTNVSTCFVKIWNTAPSSGNNSHFSILISCFVTISELISFSE